MPDVSARAMALSTRAQPGGPDRVRAVGNQLLEAMPRKAFALLRSQLEPVHLEFGEMLHHQGELIGHVYFPVRALVSLLVVTEGHPALEVGLIGREGMAGVGLALGDTFASVGAMVQGSGSALRMSAAALQQEVSGNFALQHLLLRFAAALMGQVSQAAVCNRFHVVEQRLARWLLMSSDRLLLAEFRMTHEFLAHMLGVRRVGVTQAAHALQRRGLIDYHRGMITIVDRAGLEAQSCRCYLAVLALYQRVRIARAG